MDNIVSRVSAKIPGHISPSARPSVERVLIYRLGSLGDFIVSLPCLHLIAREFPHAERILLTNFPVSGKATAAESVLANSGLIHGYMRYRVGTRNIAHLSLLWWQLIRYRPQVMVYLTSIPSNPKKDLRRNLAFFRAAGIRTIIGLPGDEHLACRYDASTGLYEHESERLARTLEGLGDARPNDLDNWDLRLTQSEKDSARPKLLPFADSPFIACSVGTKAQAKHWTIENWIDLLRKLADDRPNWGLLLIGSADERADCDRLAALWKGTAINVCGQSSPRQTSALLAGAQLFVGHDSGPIHLAASAKVPCIGIYSAQSLPGIWFPYGGIHRVFYKNVDCMGCGLLTCIEQKKKCILSITADDVLAAINSKAPLSG